MKNKCLNGKVEMNYGADDFCYIIAKNGKRVDLTEWMDKLNGKRVDIVISILKDKK